MEERNGVRVGQRVRDLDGTPLGRVKRLYDTGFMVTKGFPILFRSDLVAGYDEIRGVRDGELILARSSRDLFDHAFGELPPSWRIPAPSEFPIAATPAEARRLMQELAGGGIAGGATPPRREPEEPAGAHEEREEREVERVRRGSVAPPPPSHP